MQTLGQAIAVARSQAMTQTEVLPESSNEMIRAYKKHFLTIYEKECGGYIIDKRNRDVIRNIFDYAISQGPLDHNKGLWLWGDIGTGKTTLLKVLRQFDSDIKGRNEGGYPIGGFGIHNTIEVCSKFAKHGMEGLDIYINSNNVAFDELGSEAPLTGFFGNQLNVMQYILQRRYDKRKYTTTHITTNLSPDQIGERYGDRIYDRCIEMFNFVELGGCSWRK